MSAPSKKLAEDLGVIQSIEEVHGFQVRPVGPMEGSSGAGAGFSQMVSMLSGHSTMEGFKVVTDEHELLILIDDQQSCCESWGHVASEDNLGDFVGASLIEVRLTDTALNQRIVDQHGCGEYGFDGGGIQFVDLATSSGKLQMAIYNSHNGYYGHGIVIAVDSAPLFEDTL